MNEYYANKLLGEKCAWVPNEFVAYVTEALNRRGVAVSVESAGWTNCRKWLYVA